MNTHIADRYQPGIKLLKQIVPLAIVCVVTAFLTVAINIKVLLLLIVPLIIFMLRRPMFGLLVTAASTVTGFMFYLNELSASITISIPKIFGAITLLSLLIHNLYYKKSFYFGSRVLVPLIFILFSGLSITYSTVSASSIKTFFQLCGSFFFYFLAVNIIKDEKSFKQLILVLGLGYTLVGIFSIFQYFLPTMWTDEYIIQKGIVYQALVDRGIKRSSGFSHPGVISFILVMLTPYLIYLFCEAKNKAQNILFLLMIIVCATSIFLTHTRAAFLGLTLMFGLLIVKRIVRINMLILILAAIIGSIYMFLFLPSSFFSRVLSFSDYLQEGSVQVRLENQSNALELFWNNPIGGIGLGNFEELNPVERPWNKEVTNMLLEIAVEIGIPGLIAMLVLLGFLLKDSLKIEHFYQSFDECNIGTIIFTSILVSIFLSLFMSNQDFREWWLFISFPAVFYNIIKNKSVC